MTLGPLYHWSPRDRLASIKRHGLMPGKRNFHGSTYTNEVTGEQEEFLQPMLCFSLDPGTAWDHSHGCWKSSGTFDLWMIILEDTDEVHVRPAWGATLHENPGSEPHTKATTPMDRRTGSLASNLSHQHGSQRREYVPILWRQVSGAG